MAARKTGIPSARPRIGSPGVGTRPSRGVIVHDVHDVHGALQSHYAESAAEFAARFEARV